MSNRDDVLLDEILAGKGLGVAQVAKIWPSYRGDKATSPSLITRWITDGVETPSGGRVRLEAVRLSGRWVTTEGALKRFLAAQQQPANGGEKLPRPAAPKRRDRERQTAAVENELRSLGV